jgi:hypothetical protein
MAVALAGAASSAVAIIGTMFGIMAGAVANAVTVAGAVAEAVAVAVTLARTVAVTLAGIWVRNQREKLGGLVRDMAAQRLTALAVLIGGQSRAWRAEEFLSDLIRRDITSAGPPTWRQVRHASGLVYGAVIMRSRDLRKPLLGLLDWTLAKPRTETLSAMAAITAATYFLKAAGLSGLFGNLENVVAAALVLYGPGRWLRAYRCIPPVPTEHRDKALEHPPESSRK